MGTRARTSQNTAEPRGLTASKATWAAIAIVLVAVTLGGAAVTAHAWPEATVLGRPTDLRALRSTGSTVLLTWQDNAQGETGYQVRHRGLESPSWQIVHLGRNARAWKRVGLDPGRAYVFQVRGCAPRGCSQWSKTVTVAGHAAPATDFDGVPEISGCPVLPADSPWNRDVSDDPVDSRSEAYVESISRGGNGFLHADFGADPSYGIPYVVVPYSQPLVPVDFEYDDESDPGPYPLPAGAPIEAGGDRHALVLQQGACRLFELYHAEYVGPGWRAGSGAVFDLRSNALRPDTWTSADAAGLPILPGLARYDEVASGEIGHALRFTVERAQQAFVHPATHYGSSSSSDDPPMGLRLRLEASFDLSPYHGQTLVILRALKRYGLIVADEGTSWFVTGARDPRWDDEDLDQLKTVPGSAFEVVSSDRILKPEGCSADPIAHRCDARSSPSASWLPSRPRRLWAVPQRHIAASRRP